MLQLSTCPRHVLALLLLLPLLRLPAAHAEESAAVPGWTVSAGEVDTAGGPGWGAAAKPLALIFQEPVAGPRTVELRLIVGEGGRAQLALKGEDVKTPPRLSFSVTGRGGVATLAIQVDGQNLATTAVSQRTWSRSTVLLGNRRYGWRFPQVRNLWDDRDRAEIGADYADMTPPSEKVLAVRLELTDAGVQVWVDDRLLAEGRVPLDGALSMALTLTGPARLMPGTALRAPRPPGSFLALPIDDWAGSHVAAAQAAPAVTEHLARTAVPIRLPARPETDVDLGRSLYRHRLTEGSGPDAGYVNAKAAWPDPFSVDPAVAAFRVPYRAWRDVWLTAWLDEEPGAVPRGAFRFYREYGGYAARTDFEITEATIAAGKVRKLDRKAANGKALYLIHVPVDMDAMQGMTDMADQFLDFQLTKPLALGRSYPDPIYYGEHPAGPPSSIHVVGITLQEAAVEMQMRPTEFGATFQPNQPPAFVVALRNNTPAMANIHLRVTATPWRVGGEGTGAASGLAGTMGSAESAPVSMETHLPLGPDSARETTLTLPPLPRFGYHDIAVTLTVDGVEDRTLRTSLVTLPPDTRIYGIAQNETRFGAWNLWGHYTPFNTSDPDMNREVLGLLKKIGVRMIGIHSAFITQDDATAADMLPNGSHTTMSVFHRLKEDDPDQVAKMLEVEHGLVADTADIHPEQSYFYGGEWNYDHDVAYAVHPRYRGDGDLTLSEEALAKLHRQMTIFEAIGRQMRKDFPQTKLVLQWGSPMNTLGFLMENFPKELVDYYGMDAPMFELTPEIPVMSGAINQLWTLRQEIARLGWPQLGIRWCEGPFLPTNPGALTLVEQEQNYVRYMLMGMAYNISHFEAGLVPFDAGNYYGAEHYGAGVFNRVPLCNPKPAVAAFATLTRMVCGADYVGPVEIGSLSAYCQAYQRADGSRTHALWIADDTLTYGLDVAIAPEAGRTPTVTDAMGNATPLVLVDGRATLTLTGSPIWLTGVATLTDPKHTQIADAAPATLAAIAAQPKVALPAFTAANWAWDGSADEGYATNHPGSSRVTDPALGVRFGTRTVQRFGQIVPLKADTEAATIHLDQQPAGDRTLAARYGALRPADGPIPIPGRPSALGMWVHGNSSWGRFVYQIRDAKGELWTSIGTKDDWNCDDTHTWSFIKFDGWKYCTFPLPGQHPWDQARAIDTTWWKHEHGDGILDYPIALNKIIVEARNETLYLGEARVIPNRDWTMSTLSAHYETPADMKPSVLDAYASTKPLPDWTGPAGNPLADLTASATDAVSPTPSFTEPHHFNDGRTMLLGFTAKPDHTYELWLSRYPDGRGAEKLRGTFTDGATVRGLRPGIDMYLTLVETAPDKKSHAKPSPFVHLVTEDKFAEK